MGSRWRLLARNESSERELERSRSLVDSQGPFIGGTRSAERNHGRLSPIGWEPSSMLPSSKPCLNKCLRSAGRPITSGSCRVCGTGFPARWLVFGAAPEDVCWGTSLYSFVFASSRLVDSTDIGAPRVTEQFNKLLPHPALMSAEGPLNLGSKRYAIVLPTDLGPKGYFADAAENTNCHGGSI